MENQRDLKLTPQNYWKENIRLLSMLLLVWFVVSYGFGILLVEPLNTIRLFGWKLGFWFAQQGSILVFLGLIILYARGMAKLDEKYGLGEETTPNKK